MPAALMLLPSVAVPPNEPWKCATLPSVQGTGVFVVPGVELHETGPEGVDVSQVPLPAVAGLFALPVQNRGTPQAFGSTVKKMRVVKSPARMPRRFLIDWAMNLMTCAFIGMAIDG